MTHEEILTLINKELKGIDKKYMGGKNKGRYPYPGHLFELISDENEEVVKAIVAKDMPALKKGLVNIAAVCFRVLEGVEVMRIKVEDIKALSNKYIVEVAE